MLEVFEPMKLERLLKEENHSALLERIITFDKELLMLYTPSKNVSANEMLFHELRHIPYNDRVNLFSHLDSVFRKMVKKEDSIAIVNAINLYNQYRIGIKESSLIDIIENTHLNKNLRLKVAQSLSNLISPKTEYWEKLIEKKLYAFLAPALMNKAKHTNPQLVFKIFEKYDFEIRLSYIPVKRTIINIVESGENKNIKLISNLIKRLEESQQFEKCLLVKKILDIPQLSDWRSKIYSLKYVDVEEDIAIETLVSVCKTIDPLFRMNSDYNLDAHFEGFTISSIMHGFVLYFIQQKFDSNKELFQETFEWLQLKKGKSFHYFLTRQSVFYEPLDEVVSHVNYKISLNPSLNQTQNKFIALNEDYGSNRVERLKRVLENG
jgi:hypothetical protein